MQKCAWPVDDDEKGWWRWCRDGIDLFMAIDQVEGCATTMLVIRIFFVR